MSTDSNIAALKEAYRQWNDPKGQSIDHWLTLRCRRDGLKAVTLQLFQQYRSVILRMIRSFDHDH